MMQPGNGEWRLPDDLRQLAESGDAETVREVLDVFQTDTASRLRMMETALAGSNSTLIRKEAHSIKGSASQIGAAGLAAICHQIELEVIEGRSAQLAALIGELAMSFAGVCRAISEDLESLP